MPQVRHAIAAGRMEAPAVAMMMAALAGVAVVARDVIAAGQQEVPSAGLVMEVCAGEIAVQVNVMMALLLDPHLVPPRVLLHQLLAMHIV